MAPFGWFFSCTRITASAPGQRRRRPSVSGGWSKTVIRSYSGNGITPCSKIRGVSVDRGSHGRAFWDTPKTLTVLTLVLLTSVCARIGNRSKRTFVRNESVLGKSASNRHPDSSCIIPKINNTLRCRAHSPTPGFNTTSSRYRTSE